MRKVIAVMILLIVSSGIWAQNMDYEQELAQKRDLRNATFSNVNTYDTMMIPTQNGNGNVRAFVKLVLANGDLVYLDFYDSGVQLPASTYTDYTTYKIFYPNFYSSILMLV